LVSPNRVVDIDVQEEDRSLELGRQGRQGLGPMPLGDHPVVMEPDEPPK